MWVLALYRTHIAGCTLHEAATSLGKTPRALVRRYLQSGQRNASSYTSKDSTRLLLDHEYAVQKDTVLYRNDNKKLYRVMNFFGMSQFFFWTYLSHFAFTTMKSVQIPEEQKENKDLPWWKKTDFGKYRSGITIASFLVGWGTLALCWMYTLRSVSCLVLKRGGRELLFITFAPFGRNKSMLVPLEKVSAKQSRLSSRVNLPLKVQGKSLYYILDMKGQFTNSKLFDYSAGLRRHWAQ